MRRGFGNHRQHSLLLSVTLLALIFLLDAQLPAQIRTDTNTHTAGTLSLEQAREIAFQRNWDLLAAKSGIDAAAAQLIVAREFPNPTVSLSSTKIGDTQGGSTIGDGTMRNGIWSRSYDTIAAVTQLIEIAGKRGDRQAAARAGVMGARARFFDAKRTLDQGVTKAYLAALLAGENVHILTESSGYLTREAAIAADRFKAGDISESDKKQIEINAEQYELQARAAENAAVQARITVEILLGVNQPKGDWIPVEALGQMVTNATPQSQEDKPGAARPDVLAAEADLRASRDNLKLQKAIRIPDPTFLLQYEHEPPLLSAGNGPPVDTIGIGVSFPLPLWNLNGGNIKAARASVDQFESALGKVRTQVAADIANAESSFHEAQTRWLRYRDVTAPKSTQVRESVAFAYKKGGASLVDLLDAERTDNDVRLATAQAMSDTASTVADLNAARAVISENDLASQK